MHKSLLLTICATFFSSSILPMSLFHYFDKNYVSPENYITNSKTSELCEDLLLLDPEKPVFTPFQPDDQTLEKIDQAFEREEKKLLVTYKSICIENSYSHLEQIKMTHKALISPVDEAATNGFIRCI